MKTRIKKWKNSLVVRIPRYLAKQLGLQEGAVVDLEVIEGSLLLKAQRSRRSAYSIEDLLRGVNRESIHSLEDFPPVGQEVW